ncbi:hypothetical protein D6C78_07775 [Aureobasidium pullulans]|uniref:Uncharacterized protein n=1 Tax=Aureobasidium pullulans TaxID=5580 RepID=A0A4T0BFK2_AURPU|nr:hypothetical protein D6C78_07775 [Aureobasidium pullulans]
MTHPKSSDTSKPALSAILKCATDINLFQHLRDGGKTGLRLVDLAKETKVDTALLRRLSLHLVAMNVLACDHDRYFGTDLSNALAEENLQESIRFCYDVARPSFVHDFFNVQNIEAARAYFLHSILHNWDDKQEIRILKNVKPALKPGYSRVLLNEIILSED